ncbi:D-alanyl-D-alanine carboxypeptidase family protein [Clostridium neuense]|uniref:serine-type D-Ala-D-Ala carboxypeptidase n=1 Tax=Clostridium neuense TaxID=1728934 RepID=A0ABW8TIA0_9CLOT
MKANKFNTFVCILMTLIMLSNISIKAQDKKLYIDAKCAIAMDSKSKVVLYEKNSNTIVPMASTTKIMTALVAMKYGKLDEKFNVSKNAVSIRGSKVGYKCGEKITLRELLYGLMFRSGNDAAITIAEGIAGNVEKFSKLMNEYALEIGAFNTHFITPHGLDKEFHYCTAYDLALITSKAKEDKLFNDIVGTKDIAADKYDFTRSYHNINRILNEIPGANGVKTGYTGKAGKCLVTSVNINGNDVVFVVLNSTPRWAETKKMYNYVSKNYTYKKIISKGDKVYEGSVKYGKNKLQLYAYRDIVIPCKNNETYSTKVTISPELKAPLNKNQRVGRIDVIAAGKSIYTDYLISNSVKSTSYIKRTWGRN